MDELVAMSAGDGFGSRGDPNLLMCRRHNTEYLFRRN